MSSAFPCAYMMVKRGLSEADLGHGTIIAGTLSLLDVSSMTRSRFRLKCIVSRVLPRNTGSNKFQPVHARATAQAVLVHHYLRVWNRKGKRVDPRSETADAHLACVSPFGRFTSLLRASFCCSPLILLCSPFYRYVI
jgi:hypothetical protein